MNLKFATFLSIALCTGNYSAVAADNVPDPAFGQAGTAYIDPAANEQLDSYSGPQTGVLLHASYVYVLNALMRNGQPVSRVTRLDKHGAIDAGFGTSGHTELAGLDGLYDDYSWSTGLFDKDGNLYLAGDASIGANADMLVCRLLPTGAFDLAWGGKGTGCTTIAFDLITSGADRPSALAIQANGRLLVAGVAQADIDSHQHIAVARLNSLGLPDGSLNGGKGTVTLTMPGWKSFAAPQIALDSQQKIIVAGTARNPVMNGANLCDEDFFVTRLLPYGGVDQPFGIFSIGWDLGPTIDGCAKTHDRIAPGGLTVFPDDSMLLVGNAQFSEFDHAIAAVKLTKEGSADPSFGEGDGTLHRYVCQVCIDSYIASSKVQQDGKIVIVGATTTSTLNDAFVTRLMPDGSVDEAFDGGSAQFFDYSFDGKDVDESPGVVDVAPGRIVFAGTTATLGQTPKTRIFVTALGETAKEPASVIFMDGFE